MIKHYQIFNITSNYYWPIFHVLTAVIEILGNMFEKNRQRQRIFNIDEPTKFNLVSEITLSTDDQNIKYKTCTLAQKIHTSMLN